MPPFAARIPAWFRSAPVALTLLALVALGPLLPSVAPARAGDLLDAPHALGTVLTSAFAAPHPGRWLAALVVLALAGPPTERALGHARFVLAFAGGHLASLLGVLAVTRLVALVDPAWGAVLQRDPVSGPWAGLIVAGLAAAAAWPALWRRRVWSLAVPVAAAVVLFSGSPEAALLAVAVALGGLLGRLASRREARPAPPVDGRGERRTLVAVAVAAVVLGTVLALGSPHLVGPLAGARGMFASTSVSPEAVAAACAALPRGRECLRGTYVLASTGPGPVLLAAMPLVLQLVLADGLRRGRRAALVGTALLQGLLAALALAHLGVVASTVLSSTVTRPTDPALLLRLVPPVLVPLGVLALVLSHHTLFRVRAPRGAYRTLAVAVPVAALACVAVTVVAGLAVPDQFTPRATGAALALGGLLALLPTTALTFLTPLLLPTGPVAQALLGWLPLVPWLLTAALVRRALRPLGGEAARADESAALVRELAPASATMAWMGTWEGNRLWRSGTRPGAVAYRVHQDVAVTVGDPVCAPEDLPAVVAEFTEHCTANSLVPALYSVHPPAAEAALARGWYGVQVAEEAVIALGGVTFAGKRFQDLRTAQNRAAKEGVAARWTTWDDAGEDVRRQIRAISEAWVAGKELPEMGFTLGGLAELADPAVRLLLAEDAEGRVHGVTSWLPVHDGGAQVGLTLDFMRRAEGGFRPVMEFLLARAVLDAQAEGLRLVSLSGAPLARSAPSGAGPGEPAAVPEARGVERVLDVLGERLEPVYGFRSLHAFKEKFGPEHVPLRLCVPDPAELPRVGAALARAYLPSLSLADVLRAGSDLRKR